MKTRTVCRTNAAVQRHRPKSSDLIGVTECVWIQARSSNKLTHARFGVISNIARIS